MYRRNISHLLYPAAGILGLFIVYEALVKPAYVHSPSPVPTAEDEAPADSEMAPEPPPDEPQEPAPAQLRLIDPSGVPDTKYHETLEAIRDEIDKGNLKEAETKLAGLPTALQADAQSRLYLAILWNNLGIEQEKHEGTKSSIKAFKKAASLDTQHPLIHMNLAHAYWEQRDPGMTQEFLERLITLTPGEPFPTSRWLTCFKNETGSAKRPVTSIRLPIAQPMILRCNRTSVLSRRKCVAQNRLRGASAGWMALTLPSNTMEMPIAIPGRWC